MTHGGGSGEGTVGYAAILVGATGKVGGHILHLLVQSPLCKKVVVVTRRNVAELTNPKVEQVVVNMAKLEEELAPHAKGVDVALAAFGVGKPDGRPPRRRSNSLSGSHDNGPRIWVSCACQEANHVFSAPG